MEGRGAQYQPLAAVWSDNPMYTLRGAGEGERKEKIELEKKKEIVPKHLFDL